MMLLENNQFALRKRWNTQLPECEMEKVANAFGISFD